MFIQIQYEGDVFCFELFVPPPTWLLPFEAVAEAEAVTRNGSGRSGKKFAASGHLKAADKEAEAAKD